MRKFATTLLLITGCLALLGQDKPLWLDNNYRSAQFPNSAFLVGYAEGNINYGENAEKTIERLKLSAQTQLIESVRVIVKSKTSSETGSIGYNENYDEYSIFQNSAEKSANAEIVGMKTETYFDKNTRYIYAFAYANKYEIIGYYKANLSLLINQAESGKQTAENLEQNGEKAKARKQCGDIFPLFAKIRAAQDLLTALDNSTNAENLQTAKTENLRNFITQMSARLAQGVFVYVECEENLLGQKVDIIANKLKAELAVRGCSFVEKKEKADFVLKIKASTRESSASENIVFCYADVAVELYDMHKQKTVYSNELAEKGGSSSNEKAARKALENAVNQIIEKIKNFIN